MTKKFLALALGTAIVATGFGPLSALAAAEQPVPGAPVVTAGNNASTTSYSDALAAFNAAVSAYNTLAADSSASKSAVKDAYQNIRNAYTNLSRTIVAARAAVDQTFREAIKTATANYRAARKAATSAQAKIDADTAYQLAVAAASSARDADYAKYPAPTMPAPAAAPAPQPRPSETSGQNNGNGGPNQGDKGGKKGR
jgi:hypothetical protein